jgi:hypothetical protein
MALSLRAPSGIIAAPFADAAAVRAYLGKELKLELRANQDAAVIKALTRPEEWLAARSTAMAKIVDELSGPYLAGIAKYSDLYPTDEAVELATAEIRPLFDAKMRFLEVMQPGASLLLPQAIADNKFKAISARNIVAAEAGDLNPQFEEYYKQRRNAKKAKRARKASKK